MAVRGVICSMGSLQILRGCVCVAGEPAWVEGRL